VQEGVVTCYHMASRVTPRKIFVKIVYFGAFYASKCAPQCWT